MNPYQELRPTRLQDLTPTFGTFEGEHGKTDAQTARWYRGAGPEVNSARPFSNYVDSTVRDIIREIAGLRYSGKLPPFQPGEAIGAYVRKFPRVVSEREVADYHRKEREGNRKEMLRLREQNNVALSMLGGQWQ